MPTGRGYPTAGYKAAATQYRSATPLLDAILAPPKVIGPTIEGVRDGLTFVTEIATKKGVLQVAEPFLVPLDAPRYEPVLSGGSTATARVGLAKAAARFVPFAQALMMGLDIGQWAAENLYKGLFDELTSDPWRDQKDQYFAQIPEVIGVPQLAGWTFTSCGGIAYGEYILHNDYGFACGVGELQIAGTPPPQANVRLTEGGTAEYAVGWKNNGYIGPVGMPPNQTSFIPAWIGVRTGGMTSPTYAQLAQTVTPARTFMVGPRSDNRIPFDAIPDQDKWSNWLTERGYRVRTRLPDMPSEAFAVNPGRTYVADIQAEAITQNDYVPPGDEFPHPPGKGFKERKVTLYGGKLGMAMRIFGRYTELGEFVTCMFSSIPLKQRLKDGVTKRVPRKAQKSFMTAQGEIKTRRNVNVGLFKRAQYVFKKFDDVNIAEAIDCWQQSQASDAVIGKSNSAANNAAVKNPHWVSPKGIGGGFGP